MSQVVELLSNGTSNVVYCVSQHQSVECEGDTRTQVQEKYHCSPEKNHLQWVTYEHVSDQTDQKTMLSCLQYIIQQDWFGNGSVMVQVSANSTKMKL